MKDPILVLTGNAGGWEPALLLNSEGEKEELACFDRDNTTEAYASCSINWNNQLFIFGGNTERRQISRLTGHKLERVGSLDFEHRQGSCSVMANKVIYLCFGLYSDDHQRCRRSTGPLKQFSDVPSSSMYEHIRIQTSSSDSKLTKVMIMTHTLFR